MCTPEVLHVYLVSQENYLTMLDYSDAIKCYEWDGKAECLQIPLTSAHYVQSMRSLPN